MPSIIKKLFTTISVVLCTISFVSYSNAADINIPGFTGTANSTVTTGFSARIDRDCQSVRGYKRVDDTMRTFVNAGGYGGAAIDSSSASTQSSSSPYPPSGTSSSLYLLYNFLFL